MSTSPQYVITLVTRTPSGRVKKQDVRRPFDRVQITDMRDEDDGRIIIELIRQNNSQNGSSGGGIDIETCYLSQPKEVAYITLDGKTIQTIKFDKQFDTNEKSNTKQDSQHLRV